MIEALVSLGRDPSGKANGRLGQISCVKLPGSPWGRLERSGCYRVIQSSNPTLEAALKAKRTADNPFPFILLPPVPGKRLRFDKLNKGVSDTLLDATKPLCPIPYSVIKGALEDAV